MVQDTYFTNKGAGHILHEQWCRTHTSRTMVQDTYFTNNGAGHILHKQRCRTHTSRTMVQDTYFKQWCRTHTSRTMVQAGHILQEESRRKQLSIYLWNLYSTTSR